MPKEKEFIITGGYIPDKPDKRNYSFGAVFGAPEYPRKFTREMPDLNIPYQARVPGCVLCSYTFLNQYKSLTNDKNNLNLSWRYPFSKTGAYGAGRMLESVGNYLHDNGQPQDKFCEDNPNLPELEFMNAQLTAEGVDDATKRRIGVHWWVRTENLAELCAACFKEPIMITFGGNNPDWQKPFGEIVQKTGLDAWYHAVVLWDYDLDAGYFRIVNWWGDGLRKISINYKLTSALSFLDLPDERNIMFKNLKTATKQDNWVITGTTKRRIPDSDTFHYFKGQLGVINDPEIVSEAELAKYITGEALPSVKLMRALESVAKDIFLEE